MQSFLEILWAIILALTGAVLFGIGMVGGAGAILLALGFGGTLLVSRWRKRAGKLPKK